MLLLCRDSSCCDNKHPFCWNYSNVTLKSFQLLGRCSVTDPVTWPSCTGGDRVSQKRTKSLCYRLYYSYCWSLSRSCNIFKNETIWYKKGIFLCQDSVGLALSLVYCVFTVNLRGGFSLQFPLWTLLEWDGTGMLTILYGILYCISMYYTNKMYWSPEGKCICYSTTGNNPKR